MSAAVIVQAFQAMVARLTQSITPIIIPNMYGGANDVPHEMNLVWHFASAVEQQTGRAVVYVEYPCGGGPRIDGVIVTETRASKSWGIRRPGAPPRAADPGTSAGTPPRVPDSAF
jgi:hypothetical protein